jgi:hypothetical protein
MAVRTQSRPVWSLVSLAIITALIVGGSIGSRRAEVATVASGSGATGTDTAASSTEPVDPSISVQPSMVAATPGSSAVSPPSPPPPTRTAAPTGTPRPVATPRPTAPPSTPRSTAPPATPAPAATPAPIAPLSACPIFPSSNVWNRRVDGLAVAANSDAMIAAIGLDAALHPDFSAAGGYGIPFNVVGASTPRSSVNFQYADESDAGPYPIPSRPKIEGGSDRHLLLIDTSACTLFELYAAVKGSTGWSAGSGAIWDLDSNALRPKGWTSADAAGLPIFPGLVRYSEVAGGAIRHAIRFTAPKTCNGYVYPARHEAGSGSCGVNPPMGLRVRLKASVDIGAFGPQSRVILTALQRYGMLLADNGSPWYITGAPDSHWNDDELHHLGSLTGADFEVVDTSGFVNG